MGGTVNEIKVGLTVVAAVLMAVVAYVVLHEVMILRDSTIYFARFDTSRGAQAGAVVELKGNAVGKMLGEELVEEDTEEDQGSLVKFRLRKDVKLYKHYEFVISQDDLFGEKFIDIVDPWKGAKAEELTDRVKELAPEGYTFKGVNRAGIANMLAGAISETLQQAGETLGIESVRGSMESIGASLAETLTNVNNLVVNLNTIVEGSEGYVTGSMANVHGMSGNLLAMSADLSRVSAELAALATDPQRRDRLDAIITNVEQASTSLNGLAASLDELIGDPVLQQDVKDSVRLTKETLAETKQAVVQFQDTLERTNEVMDSAESLMGSAEDTIVEAKSKLDQFSQVGDAIEIKLGMNVRAVDKDDDQALSNEDIYVGDLNAAVGYQDTYVYFGADNIGEDNNFNLMMGYGSLAGLSFRGGVYRGELGLGAAYYDDFGAELMWYDTEDPKVNAYGYVPVADKLSLVVGGEDLGNDPVASAGVAIELE